MHESTHWFFCVFEEVSGVSLHFSASEIGTPPKKSGKQFGVGQTRFVNPNLAITAKNSKKHEISNMRARRKS